MAALPRVFVQTGTFPGQLLVLDICGTVVIMSTDIFLLFMGIGSAFGDKLLSSPLWQRVKPFDPHVLWYPLKITTSQIK